MMRKSLKAQISVFIILGVIIILFMSYLIFFNSSEKSKIFNNDNKDTQLEILPLKENIDFCLEKQVRRALIIGGIKGGFIYDNGEYYSPSSIPKNTYNGDFIANMNLNWNNLLYSTLVHHQTSVFSPNLNSNLVLDKGDGIEEVVYKYSVKEEFEKFILDEFVKCVDLQSYEKQGFEVNYEKYGGEVIGFDPSAKTVSITGIDTNIGDKIRITIGSEDVIGIVSNIENELITVKIEEANLVIPQNLESINVVLLNPKSKVNISFLDESVTAKLDFPVSLKNNEGVFTYDHSTIDIGVRFNLFLKLSNFLLSKKSMNKSIDLSDESELSELINEFDYFKENSFDGISIERTVINESQEHKKYVYSFIDSKNKIMGNPYVFNFGYENEAPQIDISRLQDNGITQEGVLFVISKNQKVEFDLKKLTSDKQAIDNYYSYFIADEYNGADAKYSLTSDGQLSFQGYQQRRYVFDIGVTDREATRITPFIFVVGFPDNTNNNAIKECVSFENNPIGDLFPIANDFKNKVYTYKDENDYTQAYAYSIFNNNPLFTDNLAKSKVKFSLGCLVSTKVYEGNVKITNKENGNIIRQEKLNNVSGEIEIDNLPFAQEVEIEIRDKKADFVVTQSYKITVYPSSCLGPDAADSEKQSLLGGTLSCCDTSKIKQSITNNAPQNFVNPSPLFADGRKVMDAPAYICHDLAKIYTSPYLKSSQSYIHSNENIWDYNSKITNLFEANIVGVCNGLSAIGDISKIESSSPDTTFKSIGIDSAVGYLERDMDIKLKTVKSASKCEFCYIANDLDYNIILDNGLVLRAGLKALNPQSTDIGVEPIYTSYETNDMYITCDDNWYRSKVGSNNYNDWNTIYTSDTNTSEEIHISKGYCYQGSNKCSGRIDSPTYQYNVDNSPRCQNWFFDGTGLVTKPNTGWECGFNQTCNNGFCS